MNNFINNIDYMADIGCKLARELNNASNPVALAVLGGTFFAARKLIPENSNNGKIAYNIAAFAVASFAASLFTISPLYTLSVGTVCLISSAAIVSVVGLAVFAMVITCSSCR